jgi:hypothetical protein
LAKLEIDNYKSLIVTNLETMNVPDKFVVAISSPGWHLKKSYAASEAAFSKKKSGRLAPLIDCVEIYIQIEVLNTFVS